MLTSGELRHVYRRTVNEWLDDNKAVGDDAHDAGLRAVEAAVRADQIEKDAAHAERDDWRNARLFGDEGTPYSNGARDWSRRSAAAIRAQLEGTTDE